MNQLKLVVIIKEVFDACVIADKKRLYLSVIVVRINEKFQKIDRGT